MVEGIVVGAIAAAAWMVMAVVLSSPWAQDSMQQPVPEVIEGIVTTAAALTAYHLAGALTETHGRWVGYGSVFGAAVVTFVVIGLVLRYSPWFRAWQFHGISIGRVPAPKSRRAPRSQRV